MNTKDKKKYIKTIGATGVLVGSTIIGTVAQTCNNIVPDTPEVTPIPDTVSIAVNALHNYDPTAGNTFETTYLVAGILVYLQTINTTITEIQSISFG